MSASENALPKVFAGQLSERRRSLEDVFDSDYLRLRGLAYVLIGDLHVAEEVVMEAFARGFASWPRLQHYDWPAGYLRKIVINLCRARGRKQAVEKRMNHLVTVRDEASPTDWDSHRSDDRLDLWDAVRKLPMRQRACVVLRYLEDMNDAAIADTLGCSVGTVKTHMSRARVSLGQMLGLTEGDDR